MGFCRETICRGHLPWVSLVYVGKPFFCVSKSFLIERKPFICEQNVFLFKMFSLLTVFLFVIGVVVIDQRTLDFNNVNFNTQQQNQAVHNCYGNNKKKHCL